MIRFLILAAQRTGSTVVGDALDQHPEISCEREMFLAGQKRPRSYSQFLQHSHWRRLEARLGPARSIESYLRGFFHAEPPVRAVGMKLMYNQRGTVLDRWIDVHRPRIIHLVRHNAVKVIVSRLTAERRGVYHVGGAICADVLVAVAAIAAPLGPRSFCGGRHRLAPSAYLNSSHPTRFLISRI